MAGIAAAVPGNHIEDISAAVEDVAAPAGYGIIRQFVGHGIGHRDARGAAGPQLPHRPTGRKLEPGLCLAIEPMFTLGGHDTRILARRLDRRDRRDGSLAAHFEHTIAVTEDGPEILTVV